MKKILGVAGINSVIIGDRGRIMVLRDDLVAELLGKAKLTA